MSQDIFKIQSISHLHQLMGIGKPSHPLISVINVADVEIGQEWIGVKMASDLYSIALKDASCGLDYGRNTYDFDDGVLIFTAPQQVLSLNKSQKKNEINGWMIYFHPDLIRKTDLGKKIDNYNFFSYDVHEALHLSDAEQKSISDCANLIKNEINERIDNHSQRVIVSTLELLLNFSLRYYERQFNTRSAKHSDVVSDFEQLLMTYYKKDQFAQEGIPTIDYFANKIHLSANYLSDLLKKETGYSAKDTINNFIIEKSKILLLSDGDSIAGIAYKLGFNYPHYFGRLFKAKTGLTPNEYRFKSMLN